MTPILISAIHFASDLVVKSTAVFAATAVALALLRRASAATRHLVGAFGLTAALLLPLLAFALPRVAVPLLPDPRPVSVEGPRRVLGAARPERLAESGEAEWRGLALTVPEKSAPPPASARAASRSGTTARRNGFPLALAAWILGSLALLARLAVGWSRVRRLTREASPIRDLVWLQERDALSSRLGLERRVEMLESEEVPVAMTAGLLRPLLLIGRAARLWAEERRRVVLLHELAHVKRGDWPALLVAELAVAVYWFHPLAWWLSRRVRRDAEQASDDLVIAAGTKPSVYAGHLLGIFRSLTSPAHPVAPALAIARPHHFEERLRAILDPRAPRRERPSGRGRLAAALLVVSAFAVAAVSPWKAAAQPPCPAVAKCPTSVHPAAAPGPVRVAVSSAEPPANEDAPAAVGEAPPPSEGIDGADAAGSGGVEGGPEVVPAVLRTVEEKVVEVANGFVKASRRSPRDGSDWYGRAMSLHREERYPEAIEAFQKAIDAGYREGTSSYNIACGYARLGDRDKAFEWLRRASEAGFDVAAYLGHDDDLDGLESDLRWAELKKSARAQKADKHRAESAGVERRFERLIAKPPAGGEPFFNIGRDLLRADRYDLAAKAYAASAERGYRPGTSLYNEACARSLAGDKAGALDRLERALDAGFDQPDLFRTDDDLDAIRDDPRFAELRREAKELALPGYGTGWWNAHSGSNRARWRESARRFQDYADKHPEKGRAWYNLGFASLAGDRPEAAADAFRKALELGYRKPTTMYNLACVYARLDQKDAAFDWLFKALDAGFDETGTLRGDDDLDNLRGDPRYRKAIDIARSRQADKED